MFATSVVPVVQSSQRSHSDVQVKQVKWSVAKAKKSAASMERYAFLFIVFQILFLTKKKRVLKKKDSGAHFDKKSNSTFPIT